VELFENLFTYTPESLLGAFQDPMMSNTCTWYMRILTASSLKQHADGFLPFIEDIVMYNNDIADYCAKEVEPMGKECEQVQIMALLETLHGVEIAIEYLDGRPFDDCPPRVSLRSNLTPDDSTGSPTRLVVSLLYRPGHYDVLYKDGFL
jgi:ubiquitin thioesterase protein OTUB1